MASAWLDPLIDQCGFGLYQFQLLFQSGVVYFSSAAIFVILGSVIDDLPLRRWDMSGVDAGLLQSSVFVGMALGTMVGGVFADRYGRRLTILSSNATMLVAGAILVSAQEYYSMVVGCLLFGAAAGKGVPAFNAILVEATPADSRGQLICWSTVVFFAGELYGAACIWVLGEADIPLPGTPPDRLHWRASLLFGILPVAPAFLYATMTMNESPRFLAARGRISEVSRVLQVMAKTNGVSPAPEVGSAAHEVEMGHTAPSSPSLSECLRVLSRWPVSGSTVCLMMLCVMTNFLYYGMIFALPQVLNSQPREGRLFGSVSAQVFMVTMCKGPGILLAFLLVRTPSIGHKTSLALLFGIVAGCAWAYPQFAGQGAFAGALGAACALKLAISAAFILLYIFALEVYPTRIRSTGMALCTMTGRLGSILSPHAHAIATAHGGSATYFLLLAACAVGAGGAALAMPQDTKGRPLGEAEEDETTALLASKK